LPWGFSYLIRDSLIDYEFVRTGHQDMKSIKSMLKNHASQGVCHHRGLNRGNRGAGHEIAGAEGASYVMYTGWSIQNQGAEYKGSHGALGAGRAARCGGGRCFAQRENRIELNRDHQVATPDLTDP
jgi:hypothetical protein